LAVSNLTISGNRGTQHEFSVSIKVPKEIVPFQQARIRIPIGSAMQKKFNPKSESDKKSATMPDATLNPKQ